VGKSDLAESIKNEISPAAPVPKVAAPAAPAAKPAAADMSMGEWGENFELMDGDNIPNDDIAAKKELIAVGL
jgi:hypothetical protein